MDKKYFYENVPDLTKIAGGIYLKDEIKIIGDVNINSELEDMIGVTVINNFLTNEDCDNIISIYNKNGNFSPVTIQGMQNVTEDNIGSHRVTGFYPNLSESLYKALQSHIFENHSDITEMVCNIHTRTDWWQHEVSNRWKLEGVSPMLRFMRYDKGGEHYAHYDAGYIYPDVNYRTLKSFVLYLTTNDSGSTRFIDDGQSRIPIMERNHDDWGRQTTEDEVILSVKPEKGKILIFDHRICHDVSEFLGNEPNRVIIRGDLIYSSVK